MIADADVLEGGLSDPVLDSQGVFRALMDAMARPARVTRIRADVAPPLALGAAAGAIACTLIDADTLYWLDPSLDHETLHRWIAFHTGARRADALADAALAFVGMPASMPAFECFAQGSQEYPDRSATLILTVPTLDEDQGWRLSGPGIAGSRAFQVQPLDERFPAEWRSNHAGFPLGVDVLFAARDRVAGLPRSTRLEA